MIFIIMKQILIKIIFKQLFNANSNNIYNIINILIDNRKKIKKIKRNSINYLTMKN